MILREIYIDGFGIFNGKTIDNLNKGINIILGENEAGKSTLLKFIRYTLFGYPRLREQRMSPLNGGNHGGRIKALMKSGDEVIFERTGNDQFTFYIHDQQFQNKTQWFQLLGNANRDIFENIYAFSLDELINLETLGKSGLEDRIFSIGSGLGNVSVGIVSESIQEKIDGIYNPRGRVQIIPGILKEINERRVRISKIQNNLPLYQQFTENIFQKDKELSELEKDIENNTILKNRLENYIKCYDSFIAVLGIDEELKKLPELHDYPVEGKEKLNKLEEEENIYELKIKETLEGDDETQGISQLQAELSELSYNEEILERSTDVDYLSGRIQLFRQAKEDREEASRDLDKRNIRIGEVLKSINSLWTEQNVLEFDEIIIHQDRIRQFKNDFENIKNQIIRVNANIQARQTGKSPVSIAHLMVLISTLSFLSSLWLFYLSLFFPGILILLGALIIFLSRKKILNENPLEKYSRELDDLNIQNENLIKAYQDYVEINLKLNKNLSSDSILDILGMIISLKNDINDRNRVKKKLKEKEEIINEFKDTAEKFKELFSTVTGDTESLVQLIIDEFNYAKKQSERKDFIIKLLRNKERILKQSEEYLLKIRNRISNLLQSVNAQTRDEFRSKYEKNDRIISLNGERKKRIETIETITGTGESLAVIDFLKSNSKVDILARISELESDVLIRGEKLKSGKEQLGELRNELKRLESESVLTEVMTELETEKQKLRFAYEEWITNKIALKLLNEVREQFEKEKQPEVIKNSGSIFKDITDGRFTRISASMDKKEILVFDSGRSAKKIEQLSRGTREQLLISLRLGFIEEYELHTEPLPVIVDEVFVNFDPERTRRAAKIFAEFSKNRQVMIFTCHPTVVNYFDNVKINLIKL